MRRSSRKLVTIGACATAGGIQALRNFADVKDFLSIVYASPEYVSTLETSTPISAHVKVDFELNGCPINKRQLLEVITAFLHGRRPNISVDERLHGVQARAAPSASWSRTARRASARSRMPAAARSAPPTTAAATAASGRWRRRTRSRSRGSCACSAWATRDVERVFRTFNVEAFEEARAADG